MACFRPMHGWLVKTPNENGRRPITFSIQEADIDKPMSIPCGKCEGCRAQKSIEWSVRLYHELQSYKQASFLTLTYDDAHLKQELCKEDLQKFFKRMRKKYAFRYFACGEYGGQTHRAHYHAIIFGHDFRDGSIDINDKLYTNEDVCAIWNQGMISIGQVSLQSIMYVAGYTQKKVADTDTFTLMSTKPAIGSTWLHQYKDEIIKNGFVVINGRKFTIPIQYMRKYDAEFADFKIQRQMEAKEKALKQAWYAIDNKQLNFRAKLSQKVEKI